MTCITRYPVPYSQYFAIKQLTF